jgi:hypothetical protein
VLGLGCIWVFWLDYIKMDLLRSTSFRLVKISIL